MRPLSSPARISLLTLTACLLQTPGSNADAQIRPLAPAGYAYAFLQPPFLIRNNWVFAPSDGTMLLAASPQALTVKLGGERPEHPRDVLPLYAQIGRLGWELISCVQGEEAAAAGLDGPGCIFKKHF